MCCVVKHIIHPCVPTKVIWLTCRPGDYPTVLHRWREGKSQHRDKSTELDRPIEAQVLKREGGRHRNRQSDRERVTVESKDKQDKK